jgi:fucose permease
MPTDFVLPAAAGSARLRASALPSLFFLLGMHFSNWISRLPAIREALSLDAATLGTVLLGGGIGSLASFPLAAWLIGRFGARRAALYTGLALIAVLPTLPLIGDWRGLMCGLFVMGALASSFDVAINALGAEMERAADRPIMSRLHAWFCVGTFSGALLGSFAAHRALPPWQHFSLVSVLLAALLSLAYQNLPCDKPDAVIGKKQLALPHGTLVWVGVIAFLGAISEGSLSDWIPLYLRDHFHTSEAVAPLAYAAFAGAMLMARLLGDALKERFGGQRLVAFSGLTAAIGIGLAVVAPSVPLTMLGFGLAGLGVAAVFPCVFSAAGREGPTALAGVATLGYAGGLIGPPMMGYVVHGLGMQAGFGLLGVVSIAVCLAAARASLLR